MSTEDNPRGAWSPCIVLLGYYLLPILFDLNLNFIFLLNHNFIPPPFQVRFHGKGGGENGDNGVPVFNHEDAREWLYKRAMYVSRNGKAE